MVEMDNIHYDGNTIVMFVYPEGDRNSRTEVIIDADTLEILSPQSINTYISMARWRIRAALGSGRELPEKEVSVWC